MRSPAVEDYLKTIYKLQSNDEMVTTQAVAGRLKVAVPSATAMIKKLAAMKMAYEQMVNENKKLNTSYKIITEDNRRLLAQLHAARK